MQVHVKSHIVTAWLTGLSDWHRQHLLPPLLLLLLVLTFIWGKYPPWSMANWVLVNISFRPSSTSGQKLYSSIGLPWLLIWSRTSTILELQHKYSEQGGREENYNWIVRFRFVRIFNIPVASLLNLKYFQTWHISGWWGNQNSPWSCAAHSRTRPSPVVRVSKNRRFIFPYYTDSECSPHCTRTQDHPSCQHLGKLVDMTGGNNQFKVQGSNNANLMINNLQESLSSKYHFSQSRSGKTYISHHIEAL